MDTELVERVLSRLGLSEAPEPDVHGLDEVYAAWGQRVPFDNLLKRVHLVELERGDVTEGAPLPGETPESFFRDWLRYGCGGTCWPASGALHALLRALGFEARRGVATMHAGDETTANHGTVSVGIDRTQYLVDPTMLFGAPLLLDAAARTEIDHPAWGVQCEPSGEQLVVTWRALHAEQPLRCRIEGWGMTQEAFAKRYAATRAWGPLNFATTLRLNRGDEVIGLGMGERVRIDARGQRSAQRVSRDARQRFLIDEVGIVESLAQRLPDDRPAVPRPAP